MNIKLHFQQPVRIETIMKAKFSNTFGKYSHHKKVKFSREDVIEIPGVFLKADDILCYQIKWPGADESYAEITLRNGRKIYVSARDWDLSILEDRMKEIGIY
jgi:hypothetical protein